MADDWTLVEYRPGRYAKVTPEGEFLGECGMGISDATGIGDADQVTAFEVWLFDKNDIQTVTKEVMSAHAMRMPRCWGSRVTSSMKSGTLKRPIACGPRPQPGCDAPLGSASPASPFAASSFAAASAAARS